MHTTRVGLDAAPSPAQPSPPKPSLFNSPAKQQRQRPVPRHIHPVLHCA